MLPRRGPSPESPDNGGRLALPLAVDNLRKSLLHSRAHHRHRFRKQRILAAEVVDQQPRFAAHLRRQWPQRQVGNAVLEDVRDGSVQEILAPPGIGSLLHVTTVTCNTRYSQAISANTDFRSTLSRMRARALVTLCFAFTFFGLTLLNVHAQEKTSLPVVVIAHVTVINPGNSSVTADRTVIIKGAK